MRLTALIIRPPSTRRRRLDGTRRNVRIRSGMMGIRPLARKRPAFAAVVIAVLIGLWPSAAPAQVFIASRPHPEFGIGPLFVSVDVDKNDVWPAHRAVAVTVSWNLVLPENRSATDVAQDLYLLWPGEVPGVAGDQGADPSLAHQVGAAGFRIKEHGRLRVSGRRRSDIGTSAAFRPLGEAGYVTFGADGPVRGASGATI